MTLHSVQNRERSEWVLRVTQAGILCNHGMVGGVEMSIGPTRYRMVVLTSWDRLICDCE